MALYSLSGNGCDSSRRAFSPKRSGFVVPTTAVCTPGTLKTKRNAMAIDSSAESLLKKSKFSFRNRS